MYLTRNKLALVLVRMSPKCTTSSIVAGPTLKVVDEIEPVKYLPICAIVCKDCIGSKSIGY